MLFKNIPENLFTPLASPNKHIYSECIFTIFKYTKSGLSFGIEREVIVDILERYFDIQNDNLLDEGSTYTHSRDKANHVLRKLIEYGWLDVEKMNNYKEYINFNDYAVDIINTLNSLSKKSNFEYEGYISTIYIWLKSDITEDQRYLLLETVYKNTDNLIIGLKRLNSNIRRYMEELTSNNSVSEIMETLLNEYRSNIIDKGYHRLVTSDNVSKYRPYIIEKLTELSLDSEFIIGAGVQLAQQANINEAEAIEEVKNMLESIMSAFRTLDILLNEIDIKNSKYQRFAKNRAKFLLNNSADISGQLNTVLKLISEDTSKSNTSLNDIYDNDIFSELFTIQSQNFIDNESLYIPKERKPRIKKEDIEELPTKNNLDSEEPDKIYNDAIKLATRRKKLNNKVKRLLKENIEVSSKDIEVSSEDDFIDLIYMFLDGTNSNPDYEVEDTNIEIEKSKYTFTDFKIRRS